MSVRDSDDEYSRLEDRIREAMDSETLRNDDFRALALDIHSFQRRRNPAYDRFCKQRGNSQQPDDWHLIPAVPQSAFKFAELRCFAPEETARTFHTSGTTGEVCGRHHFFCVDLYRSAVMRGWEFFGLPRADKIILAPAPPDAPHSSLSEMLEALPGAAQFFVGGDRQLRATELVRRLHWQVDSGESALLLGTALAFLNFFEHCAVRGLRFMLPPGSTAMETGGYKGSGRDIAKAELYAKFGEFLGLGAEDVINEYGMTELSSQFYTRGLGGVHEGGPWVRALVIDPETGREVVIGGMGVLRIFDLANLGSVIAVETQDLAVRRGRGFELIGRDPGAIPRGCSRAADERMRA